ncbi:MAG: tungstate ABC transporter substrate-binding protein WtpA [Bacteroidetes bacterium 4572_117]|nr:MAG: tungstate ABC transporter substrate-binding protein WtpA [Bacteroidetes bacterium 4572_117]
MNENKHKTLPLTSKPQSPSKNLLQIGIFKKAIGIIVIFTLLVVNFSCSSSEKKDDRNDGLTGELLVFHAGSLSLPFKKITKKFISMNPGVDIKLESAGSVASARKITDLNRYCDIFASADYKVIDEMLIPEHTDFNIKFAGNEMAIVYTEKSKYASEINEKNWHEILLKDDVHYGRSNPDADPCGYRAVLVSKLSNTYYNKPGFAEKILAKDNKYIRPKETDLLALLETGTIDYIFLYRSVAQQHKLSYLLLPDSINLKKFELKEFYSTVETQIMGKKKGETITKKGAPMVYGITMHKDAKNKKLAMGFMKFILSDGMKIMEKNGQTSLVPSVTDSFDKIPEELKGFASKGL